MTFPANLPSMMLISLDYASDHIRRDQADDDADLERKIRAASRAVVNYLGDSASMFLDSAGDPFVDSNGIVIDVPDDVQMATAMLVAEFYDGVRGDAVDAQYGYGFMSAPIIALLYPYRDVSAA